MMKIVHQPGVHDLDMLPMGSTGKMLTTYKPRAEEVLSAPYTSVVIAAFTTANARLKLLSVMQKVGRRVLYVDTDSVIYSYDGVVDPLPTGTNLGELTNELAQYGEGAYIDQFCAGGPKNYSYRVNNGRTAIKVKGVSINACNQDTVTHNKLRDLVLTGESLKVSGRQIRRKKDLTVVTTDASKQWRTCNTKRRIVNRFETLPYGYVD